MAGADAAAQQFAATIRGSEFYNALADILTPWMKEQKYSCEALLNQLRKTYYQNIIKLGTSLKDFSCIYQQRLIGGCFL